MKNNISIHSVKYNAAMNLVLTGTQFLFSFLTFSYVSHTLDSMYVGRVSFAISLVTCLSLIASLGLSTYGVRACATYRENKQELSKTVYELLLINGVAVILIFLSLLTAIFTVEKLQMDQKLYFLASISVILGGINPTWFYQGIEQYDFITFRTFLTRLLSFLFVVLMVKENQDYYWYCAGVVLIETGSNLLNYLYLRRYLVKVPLRQLHLKRHLGVIFKFFIVSIAVGAYTNLDIMLLGFLAGDVQTGYYTVGIKISRMMTSLVGAVYMVLLPRLSFYLKDGKWEEAKLLTKSSVEIVMKILLPVILFILFFADSIIAVISGSGYEEAAVVLRITIFMVFIISLSGILTNLILIPKGREDIVMRATCGGAAACFVFHLILIPVMGAAGAAITTIITESTILLIEATAIKEEERMNCTSAQIKREFFPVIGLFVYLTVIKILFRKIGLIGIVIALIGMMGFYAALLCIEKDPYMKRCIGWLRNDQRFRAKKKQ